MSNIETQNDGAETLRLRPGTPMIHDVDVWTLTLDQLEPAGLAHLASLCSDTERHRSARFVYAKDRGAYLAAHGLLRHALTQRDASRDPSEWRFEYGRYGRPELDRCLQSALRFNISHCETHVSCVVCLRLECGIDSEPPARACDRSSRLRRSLSDREYAWICDAADHVQSERFLRLWTLKEAITKALGLGLRLSFSALELDLSVAPTVHRAPPEAVGSWWLCEHRPPDRGFQAVAVRTPASDIVELTRREWA